MTDELISRAEAQRIVNRIYGCYDHDNASQCVDCDLRHKTLDALAALPSVAPPTPTILHGKVGAGSRDISEQCGFCGAAPFASCVEVEFESAVAPPTTEGRERAREIVRRWEGGNPIDSVDADNLVAMIASALPSIAPPTAKEGPSSTDYEAWLATQPVIQHAIETNQFRKGDGYQIWRSAWLACRDAPPITIGAAECVAKVREMRDERRELFSAKKGLSQKAMTTLAGQIFFANEITEALERLPQGSEEKQP